MSVSGDKDLCLGRKERQESEDEMKSIDSEMARAHPREHSANPDDSVEACNSKVSINFTLTRDECRTEVSAPASSS